MALTDTLSGEILALLAPRIATIEGGIDGERLASHKKQVTLADGSSTNQATGFFSSTFTATTGGITISLADSDDPLGAAGDDTPTSDPEGLKLRAIMIENKDDTNYIKIEQGPNGLTNWLTASGDILQVPAGGVVLATFPAGLDALTDGTDDELKISANSASVSVKISYLFG